MCAVGRAGASTSMFMEQPRSSGRVRGMCPDRCWGPPAEIWSENDNRWLKQHPEGHGSRSLPLGGVPTGGRGSPHRYRG